MTDRLDKPSAKILVLGDSGVGKSSLIHLICHSSVLSSAQWTIGCTIDVKLHNDSFLEFWDIGGSRSHKIARSFLYENYKGIMLVFDSTNKKSRANLDEWLLEVGHKASEKDLDTYHVNINVPTITVGTKMDQLSYAGLMEIERGQSRVRYSDGDASVIDFGNYSSSSLLNTTSFRTSSSLSSDHPVIYVNTQDALSFNVGSKQSDKLNNFFKSVLEGRNKGFYNKFTV